MIKMKNHLLLLFFSTLFIIVNFSGCLEVERGIRVMKLNEEPEKYINLSIEEMNGFPTLKKALNNDEILVTPNDEYDKLAILFKNTQSFKYLNNYYEISFINY